MAAPNNRGKWADSLLHCSTLLKELHVKSNLPHRRASVGNYLTQLSGRIFKNLLEFLINKLTVLCVSEGLTLCVLSAGN